MLVQAGKSGITWIDLCLFRQHDGYARYPQIHIPKNPHREGSLPYYLLGIYRFPIRWCMGNLISHVEMSAFPWSLICTVGTLWIPAELLSVVVRDKTYGFMIPERWEEYLGF